MFKIATYLFLINPGQLILYFIAGIVLFAVLLLITRELSAWYLKTNEVLTVLKEIRDRLPKPATPKEKSQKSDSIYKCQSCGTPLLTDAKYCSNCQAEHNL